MLKKWGVTLLIVALVAGCSSKTDTVKEETKMKNQKVEEKVEETKVEQVKEEPKVSSVEEEKEKRKNMLIILLSLWKRLQWQMILFKSY